MFCPSAVCNNFLFSKQIENRYTDGRTEIIFPDKTVKCIAPNGCEDTVFADGTIQKIDTQGVQTITFPNGQKEVHTTKYKVSELYFHKVLESVETF